MDHNEHNNEAEALFATKRKQQQAEEAERKRLEELERQKQQMAEEVKRLEALHAAQLEQEARLARQTQSGADAGPAGGKKSLDPKKKKLILIGAIAGLALFALAVVLILVLGSKSKPTDEPSGTRGVETTEEADLTLFYGMWKYDEYQNRYEINGDGTWAEYDLKNDRINGGVYYWEDGWLLLEDTSGDFVCSLTIGADDQLYDQDGDALSAYDTNRDDDSEYLYFDGSYYRFFDLDLSWSEARAYCIEQGGHLVTVTSPQEQGFLTSCFLTDGSDAGPWLGAYSEGAFGGGKKDWRWVTGEAWSYTDWEAGEPSNGKGIEWYAHFWKQMRWNDVAEDDPDNCHRGFICEYDDLADEAVANGFG
ncbi:MAG: hypothetical protein IKQ04_03020 [Oscillospiraceae bacterium]|nr:hypothetical protein [Oscillospiraceae bacterium]